MVVANVLPEEGDEVLSIAPAAAGLPTNTDATLSGDSLPPGALEPVFVDPRSRAQENPHIRGGLYPTD